MVKTPTEGLPLRLVDVDCNLCDSHRRRVVYETPLPDLEDRNGWAAAVRCTNAQCRCYGRVVECEDCGLRFRDPQDAEIEGAYADVVDEEYVANEAGRRATYERALARMASEGDSGGRLLDIGCYTGTFLRMALSRGWGVQGLEPSRWAAGIARAAGVPVVVGSVDEARWPGGSFDVVTLWDVVEHLRDPRGSLQRAREWLVPGGRLWLTTMDVGALFPRLVGRRWPHYLRMHLWYFSQATLRALLAKVGFDVVGMWPHVRVLQLGYAGQRLQCYGNRLARASVAAVRLLRLSEAKVSISMGDLLTVLARRPPA